MRLLRWGPKESGRWRVGEPHPALWITHGDPRDRGQGWGVVDVSRGVVMRHTRGHSFRRCVVFPKVSLERTAGPASLTFNNVHIVINVVQGHRPPDAKIV